MEQRITKRLDRSLWVVFVCLSIFCSSVRASDILIVQVFYNGFDADGSGNDFVVLYNKSSSPINLNGYEIGFFPSGTDFGWQAALNGVINGKGYYLVQYQSGNGDLLGMDPDSRQFQNIFQSGFIAVFDSSLVYDLVDFRSSTTSLSGNNLNLAILRKKSSDGSWVDTATAGESNEADFEFGPPVPRNSSFSESPTITGATTAAAFTTTYGTASTAQSFIVSGSNLTASLVATAPTGFEVSADGTTYGTTATFTQAGGSASGTLRIRLKANAAVAGNYHSQNIVLSSTGATSVNITTAANGNAVTARALAITANNDFKIFGQTKSYGSGSTAFTSSGLQNGETIGSVTITANGGTAANDNATTYILTPSLATGGTFSAGNYSITYNTGTLTVNKADQTITFGPLSEKVVGDAAFSLSASGGGSGNAVTFASSDSSVATISGASVTVVGKGTTTITASQAGNSNWNAATNVTQTLTVKSRFAAWGGTETMTPALVGLYGIGAASNSTAMAANPTSSVVSGNLTLTAIVRTNDPKLKVEGETSADLIAWATNAVTSTNTTDQTGVDTGHARKTFSVPQSSDGKKFLRLKATLSP